MSTLFINFFDIFLSVKADFSYFCGYNSHKKGLAHASPKRHFSLTCARQPTHAYLVRPLHSYSNYYTINVHDCQFC